MAIGVKNIAREWKAEAGYLYNALVDAHLFRILGIIFVLTLLAGFVAWMVEPSTFVNPFEAIWWALVTMTTVGYGDISPHLVPGKIAAMVIILLGVASFAMFTATISSVFVARRIREGEGLSDIFYTDHLVIAGWHPEGDSLLQALDTLSEGKTRIAFINDLSGALVETLLERYKDLKPKYVRGDYGKESVLKRANVGKARAVIVLPAENENMTAQQMDQHTILTALTIKSINPKVKVIAHALMHESVPHLQRSGVDKVVLRDAYVGYLLACHALVPGVPEVLDNLLAHDKGNLIDRIPIPQKFVGQTVLQVSEWVKREVKGILIGLVVEEKVIDVDDILSDDLSSIDAFIKRKFEEAGRKAEELATKKTQINPPEDRVINANEMAIVIRDAGR